MSTPARCPGRRGSWIPCGVLIGSAGLLGGSAVDGREIDFLKDVRPILEARCLSCHGPGRQEGDLRLDSRRHAERGGHTGSAILGQGDANVLWQRVSATDPTVRMPRGTPPLPDEQLAIFQAWARQGAPWSDPPVGTEAARPSTIPGIQPMRFAIRRSDLLDWDLPGWSNDRINAFVYWRNRLFGPLLLILVFAMACERCRGRLLRSVGNGSEREPHGLVRRLGNVPRSVHLVGLLSVGTWFAWSYHQRQAERADRLLAQYEERIRTLSNEGQPHHWEEATPFPRPIHPKHPPRLGGVYYRGNDERNPNLFNGGFYRTATITVGLHREDGTELRLGDAVGDEPLHVRLRIEKSPSTADVLFADSIWSETFCAELGIGETVTDPATQIFRFERVSGEVRLAKIPIRPSGEKDRIGMGTIYVHRGKIDEQGRNQSRPHYGIVYDVRVVDGRIDRRSELWMGRLFATGVVLRIPDDRIAEDEWFSFRPIPEIEGNQSTNDPLLLGIPEHFPTDR